MTKQIKTGDKVRVTKANDPDYTQGSVLTVRGFDDNVLLIQEPTNARHDGLRRMYSLDVEACAEPAQDLQVGDIARVIVRRAFFPAGPSLASRSASRPTSGNSPCSS